MLLFFFYTSYIVYIATEDLAEIKKELRNFSQWKDLGLYLGLSTERLEVIERDYRFTSDCLGAVLCDWLKRNYDIEKYGVPSWSALANAIELINCSLALTIKKNHHLS